MIKLTIDDCSSSDTHPPPTAGRTDTPPSWTEGGVVSQLDGGVELN